MNTEDKKIKLPKVGDKIYVPTSLYLGHGRDDFSGGIATISGIKEAPKESKILDYNRVMVSIEERPSTSYNWNYLFENQEKWAKEYEGKVAHPDPDYSLEFNED